MIAKGRTTIRAEIDFGYSAYSQIIKEKEAIICDDIQYMDKEIESITHDSTIDFEEKSSLCEPYESTKLEMEDRYAVFNRLMYCAIYSFWETSLCGILKYNGITPKRELSEKLEQTGFPKNPDIELLSTSIRELRNYFVHGNLFQEREDDIQPCIEKYGALGLIKGYNSYYISSADFVQAILDLVYKTLCEIDTFCLENLTPKNKIQ